MKRLFLTLVVILTTLIASNAEEKTKVYSFDDIKKLDISYLYEVHVTEGRSGKVTVVYESEYEKHIRVKYHDKESNLVLELNDIPKKFKQGKQTKIHVYLEMDTIERLVLSGAGKAYFEGCFITDDLYIDMSGATQLTGLAVKGKSLSIDCSGASKATIEGSFKEEVDLDLSGASECNLALNTDKFEGEVSGVSGIVWEGDAELCSLECSGATKVLINGKGYDINIEASGACSVDCRNFTAVNANVSLSGACKAKVHADKELRYNISRASKLTYYGNAELIDLNEYNNVIKGN